MNGHTADTTVSPFRATSGPGNIKRLLNYVVRQDKDCRRNSQLERSRGLQDDDQLTFGWKLNGHLCGLSTPGSDRPASNRRLVPCAVMRRSWSGRSEERRVGKE